MYLNVSYDKNSALKYITVCAFVNNMYNNTSKVITCVLLIGMYTHI